MKKHAVTIIAITAIFALETIALLKGINGVLMSTSVAIIAGLGGYEIASKRGTKGKDE